MKQWTYSPSPLLIKTAKEHLTSFPREPDITVYGLRLIGVLLERFILSTYFRLKIIGRDKVPAKGPFILVANHSSHLDAAILSSVLRPSQWYHAYAVAAQDYFFRSFFKALTAIMFTNAIPFDREENPERSLELCAEVLQVSREAIVMFPEGTRSSDGSIRMFRPGVGRLLAGTEIPAIPAYIHGAHQARPKGHIFPRPQRVTLRIGHPRRYTHFPSTREGYISISNDLREAVLHLKARG
jgi:1-acyl-sn-glycerol-3-phosphate acyltransferase